MKKMAILALAVPLAAQQTPLLSNKDLSDLTLRTLQLIESVSIVVPDLPRATGPLVEQLRGTKEQLDRSPASPLPMFNFLENSKKFLAIAAAMPRPYPFPEVGTRQMGELTDAIGRLDAHFRARLVQQEAALRPADRDQIGRYAEANQRLSAPASGNARVVFLGDSITDGWRLNEYFPSKDYVNRGISGQITSQMLARMKPDVMDLKPQAVLILAGTNDIARGTPLQTIQNNLTAICDLADHAKIKVILATVLPIHDYNAGTNPSFAMSKTRPPATINNLNNWMRTFADNRKYTYLNYFDSVRDGAGFLQKDLADDGLHPNAKGYRIMAPLAQTAIEETLGKGMMPAKKR